MHKPIESTLSPFGTCRAHSLARSFFAQKAFYCLLVPINYCFRYVMLPSKLFRWNFWKLTSISEPGNINILPNIDIIASFYRIQRLVKYCALSVPESRQHQQQEERRSIRRQQLMEITQRHGQQFLQLKERQSEELEEQKKRHKQELEDLLQRLSLRWDGQERRHGQ